MRKRLVELIERLATRDPELVVGHIEVAPCAQSAASDDVGLLRLGTHRTVHLTLLPDADPTLAIVEGLRAHHRATRGHSGWHIELIVMPRLQIERPIMLTSRVAIANLDASVIREALLSMSDR
jgi:hypothetical protein